MARWADALQAAPELAPLVQERFDAYGLGLLATIRRDGSPRITGIETLFANDELWLGMMPDSRKALDLLRDPRFALHSATTDKMVTNGDARVSGRAQRVEDEAVVQRYRDAFKAHTGQDVPPGPMKLFKADVQELYLLRPAGDHLLIDFWREGSPPQHVDRY